MKKLFILIAVLLSYNSVFPQLKEYYKEVEQIVWVVNDLDSVMAGWKKIGFEGIFPGETTLITKQEFRGKLVDINLKSATMNMGGQTVTWIQPGKGKNAYNEFLKKNGDGAMALMHRVSSLEEINKEVERLNKLGVKVLQRGSFKSRTISIDYVFFDTQKEGKYVLGLYDGPEVPSSFTSIPNTLNMSFCQFAFAIKNPGPVSAYWEKLGFPKMEVTHSESWDKEYYGKPAEFDMNLGWQRHGKIVYEWCIPLKSPTVYEDHIKNSGEGIQHFGMTVSDMDKAIAFMEEKGFKISQSGGWGEKGKPGSGRFAYVDTESIGGETIELLWSNPE